MPLFRVAVPTTTILAQNPSNPFWIAVFRSGKKHNGKLVLPGGRVRVGYQNHLVTGERELEEELSIHIVEPQFFCVSDNPLRDVRIIPIEKLADGNPIPPELVGMSFEGHFCFDISIYGEPTADGEEGVEAFWYDLRTLNTDEFTLDHGILAMRFRIFLETGQKPELGDI